MSNAATQEETNPMSCSSTNCIFFRLIPPGVQVALIENHLMGGDCLNVGCVPSKALISAARVAHTVVNSEAYGVEVTGDIKVNFGKVSTTSKICVNLYGVHH